jgi:aspartate/methionine/tyrosine aminotransferase
MPDKTGRFQIPDTRHEMQFPERFSALPEYAFPRLRRLLDGCPPGVPEIAMSIGEPRHPLSPMVAEAIAASGSDFSRYPPVDGTPELRSAITDWIERRYGARLDPDTRIVSLNGTREGLFNAPLAFSPETKNGDRPAILMPNPFYQAYGAGALAVGAEPVPVPAMAETGFLPDYAALPPALLDRVTLCYVCSPSNPQGATADMAYWTALITLAEKHDFIILADECYSEIWRGVPPVGALEAAETAGADPERIMVFHSLSKRSSAPGLRSGFAAGGPRAIDAIKRLRAYGGAPIPHPIQHASAALWRDEAHVAASRALYDAKFALADRILGGMSGYTAPPAGFFLWLHTGDGEAAALRLWRGRGVRVLPGAYLGRETEAGPNPGHDYIRVALVADEAQVKRGLTAIRETFDADHPTERAN